MQDAERGQGLAFCGVVHSHPGGFDQPSAQDDVAFRKGLDINPHLARFVAPIITMDSGFDKSQEFQRAIGHHARLTSYIAYRSTDLAQHATVRRSSGEPHSGIKARHF